MNYSSLSQIVALNVRALLGSRRESVKTLSEATGISQSTLNRRLLGKSAFTIDELYDIAQHFNVPLQKLTGAAIVMKSKSSRN